MIKVGALAVNGELNEAKWITFSCHPAACRRRGCNVQRAATAITMTDRSQDKRVVKNKEICLWENVRLRSLTSSSECKIKAFLWNMLSAGQPSVLVRRAFQMFTCFLWLCVFNWSSPAALTVPSKTCSGWKERVQTHPVNNSKRKVWQHNGRRGNGRMSLIYFTRVAFLSLQI